MLPPIPNFSVMVSVTYNVANCSSMELSEVKQ